MEINILPPGYKNFGGQIYQLVNGTWVLMVKEDGETK